ncbi:hypothetical protein [Streptomyces sp. PTD5-9]|uniref:hypothetical protein n=1 Tax=Streptomyces sp. PTD5-9 TaxID=3120150 RepID=UPI003008A614
MDQQDFLRAEDLPAYERVLDRALGSPVVQEGRRRTPGALNNEQLRTRALAARAAIAGSAASEYRAYRRLLDAPGRPGPARSAVRREPGVGATTRGSALHAVAVLVPGLSATAAVVFGLIGLVLGAVDSHSHLAEVMLVAGLVAAGVAVVTLLAGLVGLLVVAARNRSAQDGGDTEADRARGAWEAALLEHGMLPFLVDSIARGAAGVIDAEGTGSVEGAEGPERAADAGSVGAEGADAKGTESAESAEGTRGVAGAVGRGTGVPGPRRGPGFSAPDFSSPDFTGPDFSSPDFAGPDFASPDFGSPGRMGSGRTGPGRTGRGRTGPEGLEGEEDPGHRDPGYQGPGYTGPALPGAD